MIDAAGKRPDVWIRLQAVAVSGSTSEGLMLAALPLLAVAITTDPREVSWVTAAGQSPWLLFSLFAGLLIDRTRRTTVLVAAYAAQVCAAGVLGVAALTGWLSLPLLMAVAFLITSSQVLGDGASGALVPQLVPADRLASANELIAFDGEGEPRSQYLPLRNWLVFEAGDADRRFILTLGRWFALVESYTQQLDADLSKIEDVTALLNPPDWPASFREVSTTPSSRGPGGTT